MFVAWIPIDKKKQVSACWENIDLNIIRNLRKECIIQMCRISKKSYNDVHSILLIP